MKRELVQEAPISAENVGQRSVEHVVIEEKRFCLEVVRKYRETYELVHIQEHMPLPISSRDDNAGGNDPVNLLSFSRKLRSFRKLPRTSGIVPLRLFPNT